MLHILLVLLRSLLFFVKGNRSIVLAKAGSKDRAAKHMYTVQLASIEHRQVHIRCIHAQRDALTADDPVPNAPERHHVIGLSQNFPEDLTRFVQANLNDPAAKVHVVLLF